MARQGVFGCFWVVLVAAGLAGCGSKSEADQAHDNFKLWQEAGPASYVWVVNGYHIRSDPRDLFIDTEDTYARPWRIVVDQRKAVSASDVRTGLLVGEPIETMTALMKRVIFYMEDAGYGPEDYEATFDSRWGYVKHFHAGVDDSTDVDVSCLEAGTTDEACPLESVKLEDCSGEPKPLVPMSATEIDTLAANACPAGQRLSRIAGEELTCCRP